MNSPLPGDKHLVERGNILGRHRQVGVQDHEHVPDAGLEPCRTASPFPIPPAQELAAPLRVLFDGAFDDRVGVVVRVALDEDDLGPGAHLGRALKMSPMLPASLRAGTTTETNGGRSTWELARAGRRTRW